MVLAFQTREIRELCESDAVARATLGKEKAFLLQSRLADIMAARTLAELPLGEPAVTKDDCFRVEIRLGDQGVMVLTPNHHKMPTNSNGGLDLTRVTRVRVLEVEL